MRYALIDKSGKVRNIIIWKGNQWTPPAEYMVVPAEDAHIGDTYVEHENKFIKAQPVLEEAE